MDLQTPCRCSACMASPAHGRELCQVNVAKSVWLGHQPLEVEMASEQDPNTHVWHISELIQLFHFYPTELSLMSTSSQALKLLGSPEEACICAEESCLRWQVRARFVKEGGCVTA